jgi:ferric-chelate reductase [NAD(P)H]
MGSRIEPAVLKNLSYGLYVMTSLYKDQMNGQIVNSVNQVTSKPVRLAVTVNKKNLTHDFIQESKLFGISILNETTPMSFFELFGFRSGREVDKLSQVRHRKGVTGCPVVHENTLSFVEAVVFKEIDLGSHTIFIGNAVNSEVLGNGNSLTYKYYSDEMNGVLPPKAPCYIPPSKGQ